MGKKGWKMIVKILGAYLFLLLLMFIFQRRLLYHPRPVPESRRAAQIDLQADGVTLKVSVRERPGHGAVIYFGGNAEDTSAWMSGFAAAMPEHAIYLVHYRGYGGSGGSPSEAALHADAELVYNMVVKRHPEVTVVGRSLGSGVAIRVAARHPVHHLVLITPYDSIVAVAQDRFFFVPVSLLLRDRFESWHWAPEVEAPCTLIVGSQDRVVRPERSRRLLEAFSPGVARMVVMEGAGHNNIPIDENFWRLLREPPAAGQSADPRD